MTANATVVNTNEFFCVPVGKSRQAAIFLGNLVKNAIEEGKRIPKRMEMGSDLGTCIKWIEDIGVPVIDAYSAYYSAKCRGMMKGEGQSMRVALEFISTIFGQLSADECMLGWREFCSKGKKIAAALNQLCGEASLLAKNPELLNVTKYCIEGADMLRSIADIWDLASGVAEDNEERSFTAAFHQDTPVGEVYKEFISDEPTRTSSSRRWRSSEEFLTTAEFERHDRRIAKFRDRSWGKVFTLSVIKAPKVDFYGHGTRADYQKNWDLGLTYQNELRASMKNLAYAMRRDERAHNLLRWMICGSTPSDISHRGNQLTHVRFLHHEEVAAIGRGKACYGSVVHSLFPSGQVRAEGPPSGDRGRQELPVVHRHDLQINAAYDEHQLHQLGATRG